MSLNWLAADLMTGEIIAYLPTLASQSPIRRTLGQYETNQLLLNIADGIDPAWENAIQPWKAVLIGYRGGPEDPMFPGPSGSEVIEAGLIVNSESRDLGNQVQLPVVSGEAYTDRRYCGDYTTDPAGTGATRDQNLIVSDLVTAFVADPGGVPMTVVIVGDPGTQRLRTFSDSDDKTVYAVLQELMSTDGGCEWTVHWQWLHNPERIVPVLYVGTRIGTAAPAGLGPKVTFESGILVAGGWLLDWSSKKGANIVTATLGSGPGRPVARAVATNTFGRPKLEYRTTPAVAIDDQAGLQSYADQQLLQMQNGQASVQLTARPAAGYRYGIDWSIGDDIGSVLSGPAYPTPKSAVTRCIGYEINPTADTVSPIVLGDQS